MELAVVTGSCTATIKDVSLHGHKLSLVRPADPTGEPTGSTEVAIDTTGSTTGQLVLLARGSAARQPSESRSRATDLTIVAVVDEVTETYRNAEPGARAEQSSSTERKKVNG